MRRFSPSTLLVLAILLSAVAPALAQQATRYEVSITNLTRGQVITPPVVVLHAPSFRLFSPGMPAPEALVPLAEDGMTGPLVEALEDADGVTGLAVGGGPILPGATMTVVVEGSAMPMAVSVVGMLASTNDAFFGARGLPVPPLAIRGLALPILSGPHFAAAWDAGSEANTESCDEIPGPPCGNGGVRHVEGAEGFVSIHSGVHGVGDLDPATHDWNNPVAMIRIRPLP